MFVITTDAVIYNLPPALAQAKKYAKFEVMCEGQPPHCQTVFKIENACKFETEEAALLAFKNSKHLSSVNASVEEVSQ